MNAQTSAIPADTAALRPAASAREVTAQADKKPPRPRLPVRRLIGRPVGLSLCLVFGLAHSAGAPPGAGHTAPSLAQAAAQAPTPTLAQALAQAPSQALPTPRAVLGAQALPQLGDASGMSLADERRLGDRIAGSIFRDPDHLDDPQLSDYLHSLWQPLRKSAEQRGDISPELSERLAWRLLVSRDRRINAFALPGGYLGVNLGLLAQSSSADELASVLAHELSHVSQRHIARMLSRQEQQAPWLLGGMILAALAASASDNPDVAGAALAGGQAAALQSQLNFSRDMEREADRIGFGVMTDAGFDGHGFVGLFDKLQQAARHNDDGSFPYLRSHPLTDERVAEMRNRLALGAGPREVDPLHPHGLMAARAAVLAERNPERLGQWADGLGAAGSTGTGAGAAQAYRALLAQHRLGQSAQAWTAWSALVSSMPVTQTVAWRHLGLELAVEGLYKRQLGAQAEPALAALPGLSHAALAEGSRAGLLWAARAALLLPEPGRLVPRLRTWLVEHSGDALAWHSLALLQRASGQPQAALRAEAETQAAQHDWSGAIDRLRAAQNLPVRAHDPIELAVIDSRMRIWQARLKEENLADKR